MYQYHDEEDNTYLSNEMCIKKLLERKSVEKVQSQKLFTSIDSRKYLQTLTDYLKRRKLFAVSISQNILLGSIGCNWIIIERKWRMIFHSFIVS